MIIITIYIDVIILENLVMNFIILYATGVILKIKVSYLKIFLSSFIGAIYAILEYIIKLNIYSNIFVKIILSIIMIFVAYHPQNMKSMWKEIIVFYVTTFTFGGIATYLIYVLKPQNIIIKNGMFVGTYVLKVIFIGAILGTIILIIAFKISKNKMTKNDLTCKIKIILNGREKILKAIVDTGNMLKEPITGMPVVVIEKVALYELIPKEILNNLDSILGGDFTKISDKTKQENISQN